MATAYGIPRLPLEWEDPKTGEVSTGFRESGYFPEAVVNFLALLGWNPGTEQEMFSLDELVEAFDITKCSKAGAKFDYKKAIWFNHEYMLRKSDEEIAGLFAPIVANNGVDTTMDRVRQVVHMMKDRVDFVHELWPLCAFFFIAPTEYDEKTAKKRWKEYSAQQMTELAQVLQEVEDFSVEGGAGGDEVGRGEGLQARRRDERVPPGACRYRQRVPVCLTSRPSSARRRPSVASIAPSANWDKNGRARPPFCLSRH